MMNGVKKNERERDEDELMNGVYDDWLMGE